MTLRQEADGDRHLLAIRRTSQAALGARGEGEHRPHRVVASLRQLHAHVASMPARPSGREGVATWRPCDGRWRRPARRRRRPSPGPLVDSRPRRMPRRRPGGRVGGAAREEPMADDRERWALISGRRAAWARLPGSPWRVPAIGSSESTSTPGRPPAREEVKAAIVAARLRGGLRQHERGRRREAGGRRGPAAGRDSRPPGGRPAAHLRSSCTPCLRVAAPVPR